jgi:hypothetical protein
MKPMPRSKENKRLIRAFSSTGTNTHHEGGSGRGGVGRGGSCQELGSWEQVEGLGEAAAAGGGAEAVAAAVLHGQVQGLGLLLLLHALVVVVEAVLLLVATSTLFLKI